MALADKIQKLASDYHKDVVEIRRHIHANPELSFEEFETAKYISSQLKNIGVKHEVGVADTGIVAIIDGKNPDTKTVALRADMDALPIVEANDVDYKSKNEGVMHACGHDVHSSSLLGVAKILHQVKGDFEGRVKLIFQPGEERMPGGASKMIAEGVLENPKPKTILGQHVMPFIDVGKVGFRSGLYMASADEIYVTVKGKGGHAAMPHLNIDPVLIASNIIVSLQQIVSRFASPTIPSVLSFGKVIADGATNVIPNEVYLEGTFRTFDEKWRAEAHDRMKGIAEDMARSMGGSVDFNIVKGYPALINNEEVTQVAKSNAIDYLGKENVEDIGMWLAAEDFAYYSQEMPACFYRLGTRNEAKGITSSVHTPTFNIDENALEVGMGLMTYLAIKELGN
ncbi:MAG: amidohydrolase [Bacteroidia bacterium]|nr:amidohydrolase [Bacteroidia bacterium]